MRTLLVAGLCLGVLVLGAAAGAQESVATLTLDDNSIVSFEETEAYSVQPGTTIRFQFSATTVEGRTAVWIALSDLSVGPLTLRSSDEKLLFSLAAPATGVVSRAEDGSLSVEMKALVNITLVQPEGSSMKTIPLRFTTETAEGQNLSGTTRVSLSGARLDPSTRAIELVGTSATPENGYPVPDAAVYVILSGTFDQLPGFQ